MMLYFLIRFIIIIVFLYNFNNKMLNHQFKENAHSHYKYSIEDSPSPKARKFGDNVNRQIA